MVQAKTFEQLYNASLKLLEANTLEQTYKKVCDCATELVQAKYCSVFEINNNFPTRVYSTDIKLFKVIPRAKGNIYKVYKSLKPYLKHIDDLDQIHPELKVLNIESDITVPLNYGDQKFGALSVLSPKGSRFNKEDLEVITFFATLASFSLRQIKLKEKLKEAVEDRDLFISIVAHEIRNPLTLLQAYAELITRYAAKGIQPNPDLIAKVKTSIRRVSNLISEFLNLHQIKSGTIQYDFNKEDLKKILEEAIENFRFQYPKHKIKFNTKKYDEFYPVFCDYEKMQLVILNVLKNAGKFSTHIEPITVSIANHYGKVLLKISDKGKGISKEDLQHVFDKYFTRRENGKSGMGLGLFLAKNILAAHHGTIEIESTKDAGTTVLIKIPDYTHGKKRKSVK